MIGKSKIEWTGVTWNPIRGCTKVSPGCRRCYAAVFAERFRGTDGHPYRDGFDLRLVPGMLGEPLLWPRPRMVFVNSMSDLFHEALPVEYVEAVIKVMGLTPWHTYQVLTKRADRMKELLTGPRSGAASLANVWWGVSVENRRHGLPRVVELQTVSATTRFLSIEPLLEDLGSVPLAGIDWVIVGGESGASAHPVEGAWVRSIRDQCDAANVPFFFKQWGGQNKKKAGRLLDGRTYDAMPAPSTAPMPSRTERLRLAASIAEAAAKFSPEPILRFRRNG